MLAQTGIFYKWIGKLPSTADGLTYRENEKWGCRMSVHEGLWTTGRSWAAAGLRMRALGSSQGGQGGEWKRLRELSQCCCYVLLGSKPWGYLRKKRRCQATEKDSSKGQVVSVHFIKTLEAANLQENGKNTEISIFETEACFQGFGFSFHSQPCHNLLNTMNKNVKLQKGVHHAYANTSITLTTLTNVQRRHLETCSVLLASFLLMRIHKHVFVV